MDCLSSCSMRNQSAYEIMYQLTIYAILDYFFYLLDAIIIEL